jgi:hypothetical protein
MGSRSTGRYTDYPRGDAAGVVPGEQEKCDQSIPDVELEEVAACDYYAARHEVPQRGTRVRLRVGLVGGRLAVETEQGQVVGLLPTRYSYLRRCLEQQYAYSGEVLSAVTTPVPRVTVGLAPTR